MLGAEPAVDRALDDAVDEGAEADDREQRAGEVERGLLRVAGGRQEDLAGDEAPAR